MIYYKIGAGDGKGSYKITAFDHALLESGVGNFNLVRLSSILSLGAEKRDVEKIALGSLLPIAYAVETTNEKGDCVSAAVAIGFPKVTGNAEDFCAVIMEYEGHCQREEAIAHVVKMVTEGFKNRGWELDHIEFDACEAWSYDGEYATAFAYVAEWEEEE